MSDLTKFIIDPLEEMLAPAAVPALQEFSTGLTQLLDNLLSKAGAIGAIAAPEVNLTLALANAYASNLVSTKLGTAITAAQVPRTAP